MLRPAMQRVHRDTRQENARLAARLAAVLRASLATARALKTTKRGVAFIVAVDRPTRQRLKGHGISGEGVKVRHASSGRIPDVMVSFRR